MMGMSGMGGMPSLGGLGGIPSLGGMGGLGSMMGGGGSGGSSSPSFSPSSSSSSSSSGGCPPLYLIFARGTTEMQGTFGIVGKPLCNGLQQAVPGTQCYDTVYTSSAEYMVSPGVGANTASQYMASISSRCPSTKFVLGGYSKGAMVVHKIQGRNVVGAVTFGDPLKTQPVPTTKNWKMYCQVGDPVCMNGFNMMAHLTYNMQNVPEAVQFLVQAYRQCGSTSESTSGNTSGSTSEITSGSTSGSTSGGMNGLGSMLGGGPGGMGGLGSMLGGGGMGGLGKMLGGGGMSPFGMRKRSSHSPSLPAPHNPSHKAKSGSGPKRHGHHKHGHKHSHHHQHGHKHSHHRIHSKKAPSH